MNITVSPGQSFEAPVDGEFEILFQSPFTSDELAAAALVEGNILVVAVGPLLEVVELPAVASGTGVLLTVVPGNFSPGTWILKPKVIIPPSLIPRTYPYGVVVHVIPVGGVRPAASFC